MEYDNLRGQHHKPSVQCFVNSTTGHVLVWSDAPAPFVSVVYSPNLDIEAQLPAPEIDGSTGAGFGEFTCSQHFPATVPTLENPNPPRTSKDRNFALAGRVQGHWTVERLAESQQKLKQMGAGKSREAHWLSGGPIQVFLRSQKEQPFRLDLALFTPRDRADNVVFAKSEATRLAQVPANQLQQESENHWREFWSSSAVDLDDKELEKIWYHNQYFLACCLRKGELAPGLFGNWTSGKIGTAWHGDYHMNYNTQQVFWGVFSSNHVDQNLPYVELVEDLLPMAENYAREKFGLPGAFFPHSAYPVPSQLFPTRLPPGATKPAKRPGPCRAAGGSISTHWTRTSSSGSIRFFAPPPISWWPS